MEILSELENFKTGTGTILIGQPINSNVIAAILNLAISNENISVIPLRTRANLEGVYRIIPQTEKEIFEGFS